MGMETGQMFPISTTQEASTMSVCDGLGMKVRRALVVTSDRAMAKRCRDVAMALGFEVEVAECGVDALNAARRLPPDVMVLDLELRDVHGLELVNWLHSSPNLKTVPIIITSAFALDPRDSRISQSNLLAVLRKPLQVTELDHWLSQALE